MRVYLDSSAIMKRYVEEIGSDAIDVLYSALERDSNVEALAFSAWNLGEVFGAIDTRRQRGEIEDGAALEALTLLSQETKKFVAMRKVKFVPVGSRILTRSRELILKYHIYQADALQIESARQAQAQFFISADRRLLECAKSEQLEALNPERDLGAIRSNFEGAESTHD